MKKNSWTPPASGLPHDKTTKVVYNASAYEVEKIKQDDEFRSLYLSMNLHDRDIREDAKEQGAQQKAIETAIKMLEKKYPVEEIADLTGLTVEKVLELQKQLPSKD